MRDGDLADGVYWIMDALAKTVEKGADARAGVHYENKVFRSRNYWESENCSCGFERAETAADEMVTGIHGPSLFRDNYDAYSHQIDRTLEHLGYPGADHLENCASSEPQFHHFRTGLEVTWYKRVGRSTKSNKGLTTLDWYRVVVECLESIQADFEGSKHGSH